MAFITQADLESELGGPAQLIALLDRDADGVADPALVAKAISKAHGEVVSALAVAVDVTTIQAPYPDVLVHHEGVLAAYWAWIIGGKGQAMPPEVKAARDESMQWLDRAASNTRALGISPYPNAQLDVGQVDPDPYGTRVTRDTMKGFA